MDTPLLKKLWEDKYQIVPEQFQKIKQVDAVATGFNANIDAVYHMSAQKLKELIEQQSLSLEELKNLERTSILDEKDFLKGVFRSFSLGIAEEWICENEKVYQWLQKNIGYMHLQIGGQGGIMANVLSVLGVKKVFVHTNSLPALQAEQFEKRDNLLSFDQNGHIQPAYLIDRSQDLPLIHWIIEFKRGDIIELEGQKFKCPKANRFIATYDPLNLRLVLDQNFMKAMLQTPLNFVILSGFHALLSSNNGVELIEGIVPKILELKQKNPSAIFHLEVASTQDISIRKAIVQKLIPLMDSIGINDRETIDLLFALGEKSLAKRCDEKTTAESLLKGLSKIKEKTGVKRIELHMFGLYLTLQDKNFHITPEKNLNAMLTASVVAASKAKTGSVEFENIQQVKYDVSDVGLIEIDSLGLLLGQSELITSGIGRYRSWDLIVVPTILIENPLSLVGMGDTISSVSLVAAR